MRVTIEMAGMPRGKGAGRAFSTAKGIRVRTPEKTRHYEDQLGVAGAAAMADAPPVDDAVCVIVEVRFPIPPSWSDKKKRAALGGALRPAIKPDCDNLMKSVGDGLNQIVWRDDKQIVEATVRKVYSTHPGLTIICTTIDHDHQPTALLGDR